MSWIHVRTAIAALAIAATASAAGDEASKMSARGYVLSGEMLLFPAAEQHLPSGWSLVPEGALTEGATVIQLRGFSEVTTQGADLFSIFSQPMPTGEGQLLLQGSGSELGLGDVSLAIAEGSWSFLAGGEKLSGRPVFEMLPGARSIQVQNENEFVLQAELALSPTLLAELGLDASETRTVGAVTLLASAYFDPARPVAERASAAAVIGPDVIVSTIGSSLNKDGTVGNITAYSVTTVSCNIGDQNAIWIDCTSGSSCNQHPVIGTELYRLKPVNGANQFEQLGMSWLKHGFCAADAPSCGSPYTPNNSCDWLGLFATDTYDAGLNGSQPNLGPRSEIQPFTGAFPYPYILAWSQSGNAIYKRTQVASADVDLAQNASSQYFCEVVYITTDESTTNGVRNNNYSTRKATLGANYALSLVGSTIQQVPAVQHWATVEPGVQVRVVDVPGDGRFILAYKVTSIGGGQYHYEYALLNSNCDRAGQSFEIPLSVGASCTNVGFSDPEYHSGEVYSNTDWTATVTPNAGVAWAGETFAQNVNANALRWSTTYSFRFDSNGVPTPGTATLNLFKPGSPASITFPVDVPGQTCSIFNYCTSSVTTHGCSPQISGAGTPSASATSGFTISCANVEGQQSGLFFYGSTPTAVAWALGSTSLRCVAQPISRMTPVLGSGGTANQCDGSFAVDWNAWVSTHPGSQGSPFSTGQTLYAQCWFRDPTAISGTNLSNALGFSLCP